MPTTVPNRPINGAADPMVASELRRASRLSDSRARLTSIALSMRICRPIGDLAPRSKDFFHSRMADTKIALMPADFLSDSVRYNSSSDWPDQNTCSNWSSWRRNLPNEIHLSATIAQVQIDAPTRPSITILTTNQPA